MPPVIQSGHNNNIQGVFVENPNNDYNYHNEPGNLIEPRPLIQHPVQTIGTTESSKYNKDQKLKVKIRYYDRNTRVGK